MPKLNKISSRYFSNFTKWNIYKAKAPIPAIINNKLWSNIFKHFKPLEIKLFITYSLNLSHESINDKLSWQYLINILHCSF